MRSSAAFAVMLLAIWVLAWGSVTWANVASGIVVVVALLVVVPDGRRPGRRVTFRPVPFVRLALRYLRDIVVSNAQLSVEVLRRRPRLSTAIVRVPLAGCSPEALTTIANLVAMTPGEMPVEVEADPPVMYVHVLRFTSADEVRRGIWALRDQVLAAFGTDEEIAAARAEERAAGVDVGDGPAGRGARRGRGIGPGTTGEGP
jgi:multicomponent Na+:H+ antiporter subunit E